MIFLLDSTIKVALLLAAALGICGLLRRQSAAVRHWVLAAAVIVSALLPALSLTMPEWSVNPYSLTALPDAGAAAVETAPQPGSMETPAALPPTAGRTFDPAMAVLAVWGIGAAITLAVLAAGVGWLARIGARSIPLSGGWPGIAAEIACGYGLRRRLRLSECREAALLVTWGVRRPRVLMPAGAEVWSDDRIRAVLAHELAHVSRRDWLVQMTAELLRAVYWFHPLVWVAVRRLRQESEQACDDAALNLGIPNTEYAAQLLDVARTLRLQGRVWSPALAMAVPSTLERRFSAMLNPALNRRGLSRAVAFAAFIVAAAVAVPLAALTVAPAEAVPLPQVTLPAVAPAQPVLGGQRPQAPVLAEGEAAVVAPVQGRLRMVPAERRGARLTGNVRDGAGTPVARATVIVSSPDGRTRGITTTNRGGGYVVGLEQGNYVVQVFAPGFGPSRMVPVAIDSDEQVVQQDVTMDIGFVPPPSPEEAAGAGGTVRPQGRPGYQRIGGSVATANLISRVDPEYPQYAADNGIRGIVILETFIDEQGTVERLRVISGHPRLAEAAAAAVQQWRYRPVLLNGEPVKVVTTVTVRFDPD